MEYEKRITNGIYIDFIYQVGPEPAATEWVLENLRDFYPTSRIAMIVDGGYDPEPFEAIALHHNQECSKINTGKPYVEGKENSLKCMVRAGYFKTKWKQDPTNEDGRQDTWLRRICIAMEKVLFAPWIMQLEDDVIIRGHIMEPTTDLAGYWCEKHNRMPAAMQDYIHSSKDRVTLRVDKWGACGGSVMAKSKAVRAIKRYFRVEDPDHIAWLSERRDNPGAYDTNLCIHEDYLLTVVMLLCGYSFGPLQDYTSDPDKPGAVWHGDKSRYVGGDNSYNGK